MSLERFFLNSTIKSDSKKPCLVNKFSHKHSKQILKANYSLFALCFTIYKPIVMLVYCNCIQNRLKLGLIVQ
jgi:hypothetical protein